MHKSAMLRMEYFVKTYLSNVKYKMKVIDIGSQDINGSHRELFNPEQFDYVGLDLVAGKNVDIVPKKVYSWKEIENDSYDVVITSQTFEHIEFFWITFQEMVRILKPKGLMCIVCPRGFALHRFPVDCYRFDADGLFALARYGNLKVMHVSTNMQPEDDLRSEWSIPGGEDTFLIAKKPENWAGFLDISNYEYTDSNIEQYQRRFIKCAGNN